jgi:hypothetical protein
MAPSPLANDPGERYEELERAYTEDRWPDVLEQGGQLIAELSNNPDPITNDLASRAQLLLGHANLYGLRDPASALPHYQAVLAGPADPDLRRIAEEALPYCQPTVAPEASAAEEAAASPAVAEEPAPWAAIETTAAPLEDQLLDAKSNWIPQAGTAEQAITEPATPWLKQPIQLEKPIRLDQTIRTEESGVLAPLGASSREGVPMLEVEVVEEPELVEVAQADPSLAEELEVELTRIRERRAARRGDAATTQELVPPGPAAGPTPPEPDVLDDGLMEDPELLAGLLRVVVTP